MRIGLLIGALSRGGSERQLAELAVGLNQRGHEVEVCCYTGPGSFDQFVQDGGVAVRVMTPASKLAKLKAVRDWVSRFQPDVLHGFMKRASSTAILANLPARRAKVVATDFSTASYGKHKADLWVSLLLFARADVVATQTEMNARNLRRLAPWLRGKVRVVRNGVDTERFTPIVQHRPSGAAFRFVCVGSVYRVKNPLRVVEAVHLLAQRSAPPFRLDWFGRLSLSGDASPSPEHCQAVELIERYKLGELIKFHGEASQVEHAYHEADAILHPSLQEGIPNAVVEAMACGLPIVVSRVSDLPLLVQEARNGFVCDEKNPASIADAMQQMLQVEPPQREAMGARSRDLAVRWFGRERFVDDYETLYQSLVAKAAA